MSNIDLHIHTKYSDGKLDVADIEGFISDNNIDILSFTDHDNIEIYKHLGQYQNCRIIPGVELSAMYKGQDIHFLAYNMDLNNQLFSKMINKFKKHRKYRFLKIIDNLKKYDIFITPEDIDMIYGKFKYRAYSRAHISQTMKYLRYVDNIDSAFKKYLNEQSDVYVQKYKISPEEVIRIVHKAKGLIFIAHPGYIRNNNILNELTDMNIDGIEVFHPKHKIKLINKLLKLARRKDLFVSGGTDWHLADMYFPVPESNELYEYVKEWVL